MNGRAYDPLVGRFLSADPYIQAPDNTQNLNRYSYCLNNPLRYSDPSGEFFFVAGVLLLGGGLIMQDAGVMNNNGLLQGLGSIFTMVGSVALSAGFTAGAPLFASTSFLGGATYYGLSGFTSTFGISYCSGAGFESSISSGLLWGGIAGLSAGIEGGITARKHNGNFFTGKGGSYFLDDEIIGVGDFSSSCFSNEAEMQDFVYSKNGWRKGKYGISDIDIDDEIWLQDKKTGSIRYRGSDGGLYRIPADAPGVSTPLGGFCQSNQTSVFSIETTIYMSPRPLLEDFVNTLNHEFIHSYHMVAGLQAILGNRFRSFTEKSAYTFDFWHGVKGAIYGLKKFSYDGGLNIYDWPYHLLINK